MYRSVAVKLARTKQSYYISIGCGFLSGDADWPCGHLFNQGRKIAIVSNKTVYDLYGESLLARFAKTGVKTHVHLIGDGERYKNLRTLENTLAFFSENKIGRDDAVLAFGGGVVGDLAGFAASIHLRGISFFQMPTTLLSMIDSSVGGKTGINTRFGKNLVGAFYQPSDVLIDTDVLATLPKRELTAGLCEAIKQGVIGGKTLFKKTQEIVEKISDGDFSELITSDVMFDFLAEQVRFKAKIVAGDERELISGTDAKSRKILNFGHTFAHALEKATNYRYLKHGEAVGYGILFAAELSNKLGILDKDSVSLLNNVVRRAGKLPQLRHIVSEEVFKAFAFDKKFVGQNLQWILLKGIGQPVIVSQNEIPQRLFRNFTEQFIITN